MTSGTLTELIGAARTVAILAMVLYVALLGAWRAFPTDRSSTRIVAAGVGAVGLVVILAQLLGAIGLYTRSVVAVAVLLVAGLAHVRWRQGAGLRDEFDRATHALRRMSMVGQLVTTTAVAAWTIAAWRAVTTLPLGWDAFTYHLASAATFVQTGRLASVAGPFAMDHYASFPKNAELFASFLMLQTHDDLLVGLMNVGLLALAWTTLYALACAIDAVPADAALGATAVAASPFLYAFSTGSNADVFVFATSVASVLFLVRWLRTSTPADAGVAVAAVGLALGAKYTALTTGAVVLAVMLTRAVARRECGWRQLVVAVVLLAACGGRQYVLNAVQTGNPVYPLEIEGAGRVLVPGSPYTNWLAADLGGGSRGDDRFAFSGMFHYYPGWKTPTSAGPLYVLLMPMACLALVWPRGRSESGARRLVVGLALLVLVVAYLPDSGLPALSRRFWPGSASRLVGVSFGLCGAAAMWLTSRVGRWPGLGLRAALVAAVAWNLATVIPYPLPAPALRSTLSWRDIGAIDEADAAPTDFRAGWAALEHEAPLRVALAADDSRRGQSRFIYPLMGRRLQHTVLYLPVNAAYPPGSAGFVLQRDPRETDWLAVVVGARVQRVVVQAPWPIEDEWMQRQPERFVRVFDDPAMRIYAVSDR